MDPVFKSPPAAKSLIRDPANIASTLQCLIGTSFPLTRKSRTDGANMRKLVADTLMQAGVPRVAEQGSYEILPPKGKGVPKNLLEYIDTYIVTSGGSYNLQVWNRNPAAESIQVLYSDGESFSALEVRIVLVKVDMTNEKIESVAVMTPQYIEARFGKFGKPTVKYQLIISASARQEVLQSGSSLLFYDDLEGVQTSSELQVSGVASIHDEPTATELLPLARIRDAVERSIIGSTISAAATKTRGQALEEAVAHSLGYSRRPEELLAVGYPDIRHQALEVKIQDSPTVDLGKYTPEFDEEVPSCPGFSTEKIRYLIALSNPENDVIEGAILCPGLMLGKHFSHVADKSYKCQRSIPMSTFDEISGRSVFNPAYG